MELQITPKAGKVVIDNEAELRAAVAKIAERYTGIVALDKAQAKKDRTEIGKVLKSIDDGRKAVKKQMLAPYEAFEDKLKAITAELEQARADIDTQVKAFEEAERAEKREKIAELFAGMDNPHGVALEAVWSEKWLNASATLRAITAEMAAALDSINTNVSIIESLKSPYADELKRLAISGAGMGEIIAKQEEYTRVKVGLDVPKTPAEVVSELSQADPRNDYAATPEGVQVKAKTRSYRITVTCSPARYDDLIKYLDYNGFFFLTEEV